MTKKNSPIQLIHFSVCPSHVSLSLYRQAWIYICKIISLLLLTIRITRKSTISIDLWQCNDNLRVIINYRGNRKNELSGMEAESSGRVGDRER